MNLVGREVGFGNNVISVSVRRDVGALAEDGGRMMEIKTQFYIGPGPGSLGTLRDWSWMEVVHEENYRKVERVSSV